MNRRAASAALLRKVYGDTAKPPPFPKPLPAGEAGVAARGDRRYLWTDALGVLAYVGLARGSETPGEREAYLDAARRLASATHTALASPAPGGPPMSAAPALGLGHHLVEHAGVRIGKPRSAPQTDAGMELDGQYCHYLTMWTFALGRLALATGDHDLARLAAATVLSVHDALVVRDSTTGTPRAVRWKLNVDATPVQGCPAGVRDALAGIVAYEVVCRAGGSNTDLEDATSDMRALAAQSVEDGLVTTDTLGWGLNAWELSWLAGPNVDAYRDAVSNLASLVLFQQVGTTGMAFRDYGALAGARLVGPCADSAAQMALGAAEPELSRPDDAPHAAISAVTLACALVPESLARGPNDAPVLLH